MNCWHCKTELIWGGDHDCEVKGVSFLKGPGKWRASANIDGKKTNLGTFYDLKDAIAARRAVGL